MRFGSTTKVLAECKLEYYRISECVVKKQCASSLSCQLPASSPQATLRISIHHPSLIVDGAILHSTAGAFA